MVTSRATLSAFVQAPTKVIRQLDDGDVLLTRRGGQSLRLSVAADAERGALALEHASAVIGALAEIEGESAVQAVEKAFPWSMILTASERRDFADEYFATLRASAALRQFAPIEIVEAAWRSTAELRADPELQAKLHHRAENEPLVAARKPRRSR